MKIGCKNIVVFLICLLSVMVNGQDTVATYYPIQSESSSKKFSFLELNFNVHTPLLKFGNNTNRDAMFGGEISFLHQLKADKPLFWGLRYNWSPYESADATITEILDFSEVDFDYHTYCNVQGMYGLMRFYPKISFWQVEPYVNVIFGGKWLYSATTKTLIDSEDSSDFFTESSDFSLSYGAGLGFNINVAENIYLNLNGEYVPGLQAEYLGVKIDGEIITTTAEAYELKRSNTNMYTYSLGVTILLND